ncbi:putative NRPS-like protein biosynthetic cluster [Pyricularia oryzae]|nr:putative NRPS-like protein biosynthetic cluster [Pyricularia oryzae]KAI6277442.1 putative NRPS-like protein biosynthetic cluster [Pyricularia oryzae]KAI6323025.1 putative NRPS-like protein biosynthetic cluster [Pyricularia oryzae]KAI6468244.1 putative NRPS-like protein biosynthetic cluster [Pyricularia oryzae]KAI6493550.1 putative NRPS-like protein biosynthetic cluster [Pyricularia oryzae]
MIYTTPSCIPRLPSQALDSTTIHEFLFSKKGSNRHPLATSKPAFTCGITGNSYTAAQASIRVDLLARSLADRLQWHVNDGESLDKVVGIFSLNAMDGLTASWAAHRLNGVSCPLSAMYSTSELTRQLLEVQCKAIFTCVPLLDVALAAASASGIPRERVYLLQVPECVMNGKVPPNDLVTTEQMIEQGHHLPALEPICWVEGQGARQPAFLCASSGTSGAPKSVMTSHHNVIANMVMMATLYSANRAASEPRELCLGVLPQSHCYGLFVNNHATIYAGDGVVVVPRFEVDETLAAVERLGVARLWLVPAQIVALAKAAATLARRYDLTSVRDVFTGGSALTEELSAAFGTLVPRCASIRQQYGLTETTAVVSSDLPDDAVPGSCGVICPGFEARVLGEGGRDVGPGQAGELVLRAPNVSMGYLNNEVATRESLTDEGWFRTGDLVEMRPSAKGNYHLVVVDRIKELIKVMGMQVAPVEVENQLLLHPAVAEVCVVPVPDPSAGEIPCAYVVRSTAYRDVDAHWLKEQIFDHAADSLAQYKWPKGGIEFVDALPKTASGKIQRRVVKNMALDHLRAEAARKALETKVIRVHNEKVNGFKAPVIVEVIEFDSDDDDY